MNENVVANTLIKASDVSALIIVSLITAVLYIYASTYISIVNEYSLVFFALFEVVAFTGVMGYKQWK